MLETTFTIVMHNAVTATLLACLVWIVTRFFRSAPLAHLLWLAVLVRLVMPPLFTVPFSYPEQAQPLSISASLEPEEQPLPFSEVEPGVSSEQVFEIAPEVATIAPQTNFDLGQAILRQWQIIGFSIWMLGVLYFGSLAVWRVVQFQRILRRAETVDAAIIEEVRSISKRVGLRREPSICVSGARISPLVFGVLHPVVLLPLSLLGQLTEPERHTLIAHELAHVKRCDTWRVWYEFCVVTLYWWHPVAWIVRMQLRRTADQCCDGWVLRWFPNKEISYAEGMIKTLDFIAEQKSTTPSLACGIGEFKSMQERLRRVLSRTTRARMSILQMSFLAVPLICALIAYPILSSDPADDLQLGDLPFRRPPVDLTLEKIPPITVAGKKIYFTRDSISNQINAHFMEGFEIAHVEVLRQTKSLGTVFLETRNGMVSPEALGALRDVPMKGLALRGSFTDEHIRALAGHAHLEGLSFYKTLITDVAADTLQTLPKVNKLTVSDSDITDACLAKIATLSNLTSLDFSNCENITDKGVAEIATLRKLTSLEFYKCANITDAAASPISRFQSLERLYLNYNPLLTSKVVKPLCSLSKLRRLELDGIKMTAKDCAEFARLTQLVTLSLCEAGIDDGAAEVLSELASLRCLTIEESPLSDDGVAKLTRLSGLIGLGLYGTNITDRGAKYLANFKHLEELDLSFTHVTDEGLKELTGLKHLTRLSLANTPVTDLSIPVFESFPDLRSLRVKDTSMTASGVDSLEKRNSQLRVSPLTRPTPEALLALTPPDPLRGIHTHVSPITGRTNVSLLLKFSPLEARQIEFIASQKQIGKIHISGEPTGPVPDLAPLLDIPLIGLALSSVPITDQDLMKLNGHPSIESIELSGAKLTGEGLATLRSFPKLNSLTIRDSEFADEGLVEIGKLGSLHTLTLSKLPNITEKGIASISQLQSLQKLSLSTLPNITEQSIAPLGNLGSLRELSILHCNQLSGSIIGDSLSRLTNLESLRLDGMKITADEIASIVDFPHLRVLSVKDSGIDDEGAKVIAQSVKLELLSLDNCSVGDVGISHLKQLPSLERLFLANTAITDRSMTDIATMRNLECLQISSTRITDRGMEEIRQLDKIWSLILTDTAVTAASIPIFEGLPKLHFLILTGTAISESELAGLIKRRPELDVSPKPLPKR